jgi:hypothetical protein
LRIVHAVPLRRNRDFVLLQGGQLLSNFGTQSTRLRFLWSSAFLRTIVLIFTLAQFIFPGVTLALAAYDGR